MAATRKLHLDIERCLKKVAEGLVVFDAVWNKLHSTDIPSMKEKYTDDLKREIKKLQRYRDQIKSWTLMEQIKDKSALVENRKTIETRMEKFKQHERDIKKKAFSETSLKVLNDCDPIEKKRAEMIKWVNDSIDAIQYQIDKFECEVESSYIKGKLIKNELDRVAQLTSQIKRHGFHIENLETALRLFLNMSIEMEEIEKIQENVEYYIESWEDIPVEDDEAVYADIVGFRPKLNELELAVQMETQPQKPLDIPEKSGTPVSIHTDVKESPSPLLRPLNRLKPKNILDETRPNVNRAINTSTKTRKSLSVSVGSFKDVANVSLVRKRKCSKVHTFSSMAKPCKMTTKGSDTWGKCIQNKSKQYSFADVTSCGPTNPTEVKALPSLLEIHVALPIPVDASDCLQSIRGSTPPSSTIFSSTGHQIEMLSQTEPLNEDNSPSVLTPDVPMFEKEPCVEEELPQIYHALPVEKDSTLPFTSILQGISDRRFGDIHPSDTMENNLMHSSPNRRFLQYPYAVFKPVCPYIPPIPVKTPPYYPQQNELFVTTDDGVMSYRKFFEKISLKVLLFFFYYARGSALQLMAARALKLRNWRYHSGLCMWFKRLVNPTVTEHCEVGSYVAFDPKNFSRDLKYVYNFGFCFKYLEDVDLDLLLDVNNIAK